jgi:fructokinase
MSSIRIVAVGEVLWDLLPSGPKMGGAPANFACHARALGAESALVSRVGNDDLGREILRRLNAVGVSTATVGVDGRWPTGTVAVELAADGQPRFTINADAAWDHIAADAASVEAAWGCDAICFGTLAQRSPGSQHAIRSLVAAAPSEALRVLDLNFRPPFVDRPTVRASLDLANVLKLNDQEMPQLAEMLKLRSHSPAEQLAELGERCAVRLVALTRGAGGSLLWADGRLSDHPGFEVEVADAVGAGDAFTAAMVLNYLKGRDLDQINDRANRVAAYVCTQSGATPSLPAHLVET